MAPPPQTLFLLAPLALALAGAGCGPEPPPGPVNVPPPPTMTATQTVVATETVRPTMPIDPLGRVKRADFNRLAVELALPIFWTEDKNHSSSINPDEVVGVLSMTETTPVWVENGAFTRQFDAAYEQIAALAEKGPSEEGLDDKEKKRRALVRAELAQGRPSVVRWDFRKSSDEDRAVVRHVMNAARIVERIYAKQQGTFGLEAQIPENDPASKAMFFRNQSPFCEQPKTESDAACNAIPGVVPRISGLYPASIQKDASFCSALEKRKDQKALFDPFVVVQEEGDTLRPVPYTTAFKTDTDLVAAELEAAAKGIQDKGEAAFKAYLTAAAKAFRDNKWFKADEAWAKMGATNSKWYLRIGPDEVYSEPCSRKANFHVGFARINQASLEWQKKLEPHKEDMEKEVAGLAGAPYKARKVKFKLPDFIDVVLNAGDSRSAVGATIGQSLPNWGPVAEKGGRTVAMTNLYTDQDSIDALRAQVASVMCKATNDAMSMDNGVLTMSTVLHEAAHNLGPAHEYKVDKKTDDEIFGGPLAAILEELKAQTSSLYLSEWLLKKGTIDLDMTQKAHLRDIAWAFGHIAAGMYTSDKKPRTYSQLAAIQLGIFLKDGAIAWNEGETAANGTDKGCLSVTLAKLPDSIAAMAKQIYGIKGRGDKEAALKLIAAYVDADDAWKKIRQTIQDRWLRHPKSSFVYSIEM